MVFMRDSERAAAIAREAGVDAGLHLNLTTPFSTSCCPGRLAEHQAALAACLRKHAYARVMFHPRLMRSFEYVVKAQIEEFHRLCGAELKRLDGHHHMHLCSNLLFSRLLPPGIVVRRSFSFWPGEKSLVNQFYFGVVDRRLAKRYRLVDFLFNLVPLDPARLDRVLWLARHSVVEVETHPYNLEEYHFLMQGRLLRLAGDIPVAARFGL
jgi:hypothetical protein